VSDDRLCICCESRTRSNDLKVGTVLQICDRCYALKDGSPPNIGAGVDDEVIERTVRRRPAERGTETMTKADDGKKYDDHGRLLCAVCERRVVVRRHRLTLCEKCYMDRDIRRKRQGEVGVIPGRGGPRKNTGPKCSGPVEQPSTTALAKVEPVNESKALRLRVVEREKTKDAIRAMLKLVARQAVEDVLEQIKRDMFDERTA
jgi:hypothetical protein